MPLIADLIGAIFIWLVKGCKTKLKDEIKSVFLCEEETKNRVVGIFVIFFLFVIGFCIAGLIW